MKEAPTHPTPAGASRDPEAFLKNIDVRVVVFSLRGEQLHVLLAPGPSGRWELPGSRVPAEKSLEATATESVLRMTGLREAYLEQLYTYGEADRSGPEQDRQVSVVYFAIIPAGATAPHMDKDEHDARWFPVEGILTETAAAGQQNEGISGAGQQEVVAYGLRRLRYKLEYTAVGFQLLPEQFSLSQLQKTYEMILGENLDKRNFRRRILQAGIIEETPHRRSGEGRPARLYRYRPDAVAEVKARRLFP
jgi:8-oxo-dGTP diphosphatase